MCVITMLLFLIKPSNTLHIVTGSLQLYAYTTLSICKNAFLCGF